MADYNHETGTLIGKGGLEIYFQSWKAEYPRGILVISHGLGEHSGRYQYLVEHLKGKRISVYALDHRGHGRSAGRRGHVMDFGEYADDLSYFINFARDENPRLGIFLLGHSMGGIIAMKYAISHQDVLAGLILSSPALISVVEAPRLKVAMGRFLSRYFPSLQVSNELDANHISHDPFEVERYRNDELNHDRISLRWYTEFVRQSQECLEKASGITAPLLVIHGTDDRIVDFSGSIKTHEHSSSADREIRLFEGLYHETMNEVEHEREKVLLTVSKWILARTAKPKSPAAKPVIKKKPAVKKKK